MTWDESQHPRVPKGSGDPSGEFAHATGGLDILHMSDEDAQNLIPTKVRKPTKEEIARFFDAMTNKNDIYTEKGYNAVLAQMKAELGFQMGQKYSGINWYSDDVREMMRLSLSRFPSLGRADNRMAFLTVAAIMSRGADPGAQINDALMAYAGLEKSGFKSFQENRDNGKQWGLGKEKSVLMFNYMIEQMGLKGSVKYLLSEHTVADLRTMKGSSGAYSGSGSNLLSGKESSIAVGFSALGPKIGNFVRNMNGASDVTTKDRWATRTVNRLSGRMMGPAGLRDSPDGQRHGDVMDRLFRETGSAYGLQQQQAQAGLWFYEQSLWQKLGYRRNEGSLAAGARRYLGRTGGASGSGSRPVRVSISPRRNLPKARRGVSIPPKGR